MSIVLTQALLLFCLHPCAEQWSAVVRCPAGLTYYALLHRRVLHFTTTAVSCCRGKQVALDVAAGLHWLHTHRIVHFDLKVRSALWSSMLLLEEMYMLLWWGAAPLVSWQSACNARSCRLKHPTCFPKPVNFGWVILWS